MQLVDQKKPSNQEDLEPALYAALIDSMCQNFWPMLFGSICAGAAALMTALKTGNVLLWPCAGLIVAIGTARAFQMRTYERRTTPLTFGQAKYWEPRYAVGAILYAGALGAWCFITILGSDDAIAHMICIAVTIGYTAGGAARNYGSPKLIQLHILFACGPMSLALALHGGFYYIAMAVLLGLFFVSLKHINLTLHAIFVKALTSIGLGFWKLILLYWIVPLATVFLAIRYIRSVAEHYAVEHDNVLTESRTLLALFWECWLIAPWGLNYHLEHHLFPSVPCFRLGELHRLLMTRDPYPQIAHVTHGYFSGLLRDCASIQDTDDVAVSIS